MSIVHGREAGTNFGFINNCIFNTGIKSNYFSCEGFCQISCKSVTSISLCCVGYDFRCWCQTADSWKALILMIMLSYGQSIVASTIAVLSTGIVWRDTHWCGEWAGSGLSWLTRLVSDPTILTTRLLPSLPICDPC